MRSTEGISNIKKLGKGGCLDIEAVEQDAYNLIYGSEIKEEKNIEE